MLNLARRRFLQYLAASPLLQSQDSDVIADPTQAINVMDFEAAARKILPPAHFGYMATGVEDDLTLKANRSGFRRYHLRPRRLVDIAGVDTSIELFGKRCNSPVGLAPVGNMMAFHAEGEIAAARAAKVTGTLHILSTVTNSPIENVNEALGRPVWYQLYTSSRWDVTEQLVRRAEAAGTEVILVTVDTQAGSRRETFDRMRKLDKRDCAVCHGPAPADFYKRKPMFQSVDVTGLSNTNVSMTWKHIDTLKKMTRAKLLVKGIETREDALLCVESGADGVVVSNHGGRAGDSGRGTIECLPEIVDGVNGRVPVLIDGGFRRGSDVFKALALGATAVCIGRPYIWGLAAFGQAGVERVIRMIRGELELVMKQCGTRSIEEIGRSHVGRA